ncbi:MAG: hypothetical protein KY456_06400 [Chloroflexi bacterium]|nr:hypothetical protein [Chloroflexota bacterium]
MVSRLSLFVMAGVLSLGVVDLAHAQEASPSPDSSQAASCEEIEPRDAAFFETVAGTPEASANEGIPEQDAAGASPTPFAMPEGEMADEATAAAVSELYVQLIACLNANDFLRAYALYTEDYLVRNLSEEAITRLEATPVPSDESTRSEFGGLMDARMLEDGRVAALVTVSNPQSGDVLIHAILREEDGRLRIDDEAVVESEVSATPAS